LPAAQRIHVKVCHKPGKRVWARDDDGDGIREVHNNVNVGGALYYDRNRHSMIVYLEPISVGHVHMVRGPSGPFGSRLVAY
jgi:hypothetical protein